MKNISIVVIVCLIFGAAWIFYLEHESKLFVDSLPKAPPPEKKVKSPKTSAVNENNKTVPETDISEQDTSSDILQGTSTAENVKEDTNLENPEIAVPPNVSDAVSKPETVPQKTQPEPESLDVTELSIQEIIERNRKHLIQKHGDIPEVETFLKYFPFEELQQRKTKIQRSYTRSPEEDLKYRKAIATLWPKPENEEGYQDALKALESQKNK